MKKFFALGLGCRLSLACLTLLLLVSCGGDGGLVAVDSGGGGISGTGVVAARGTITGFGSVFVNGTEYFTDAATRININGQTASESALRIGMQVDLLATQNVNQSTATSINYQGNLRGPVSRIDPGNQVLSVVSQPVDLRQAAFEGFGRLADLQLGDVVEISGYLNSQGQWIATYIKTEEGTDRFKIEGHIQQHDAAAGTFYIGGQQIDYRQAGMDANLIVEGELVSVKGALCADAVLVAEDIEVEDHGLPAAEGDRVELEGLIAQLVSGEQFRVGSWLVDASGADYKNGSLDDIRTDRKVEIEGRILNGILVADQIEIED